MGKETLTHLLSPALLPSCQGIAVDEARIYLFLPLLPFPDRLINAPFFFFSTVQRCSPKIQHPPPASLFRLDRGLFLFTSHTFKTSEPCSVQSLVSPPPLLFLSFPESTGCSPTDSPSSTLSNMSTHSNMERLEAEPPVGSPVRRGHPKFRGMWKAVDRFDKTISSSTFGRIFRLEGSGHVGLFRRWGCGC